MSRESLHMDSGSQLNPVLLYLQLGEFPFISSVLHSPHWACPPIKVTSKQMGCPWKQIPRGFQGLQSCC